MSAARKLCNALLCVGACTMATGSASAADPQPYQDTLAVPAFIGDVRKFILSTIESHQWTVIGDKPGEITTQLLHATQRAKVVAKTLYGKDSLRIEFVSAEPYGCVGARRCGADSETLQRWLVTMRRDYAIELLYAAIEDAGGVVSRRGAPAATEAPAEEE